MGEILFEKTFVKHTTSLFKNYNDYVPMNKKVKNTLPDLDDIFDSIENYIEPSHIRSRNTFTFLNKIDGEKDFVENYGNPLARVEMNRTLIKVEQNGDKTVIKVFYYSRIRIAGSKYFRVKTHLKYFGVNTKSGVVYSGFISDYHKKRKFTKKTVRNNFYSSPCNTIKTYIRSLVSTYFDKESNYDTSQIAHEVFDIFLKQLNIKKDPSLNLTDDELIYKFYLDANKIKYPNNFKAFRLVYPAPKKVELKKFKNKYIDCFMNIHKLNGDKIKRALHNVENIDVNSIFAAYLLFGKDYILSQDDEIIKKIIETNLYCGVDTNLILQNQKDKHNAFEIFKLMLIGEINSSTFFDHIRFYNRLKPLENVKWKSNDYDNFLHEHYDWTEKLDHYNKGNFTRFYPEVFKKAVELPILTKEEPVFVKLLTDSKEYNFESFVQSNCVKTYLKRENSVIVSLRRNDIESKDRATIEYRIIHDGDRVVKLNRVQSLGRFNNRLDETWNYVLDSLDNRMDLLVNTDKFELPSATLEVGNRMFKTNLVVDKENMYKYIDINNNQSFVLKWDKEQVTDINGVGYHELGLFI
jgi:hypothetical protein